MIPCQWHRLLVAAIALATVLSACASRAPIATLTAATEDGLAPAPATGVPAEGSPGATPDPALLALQDTVAEPFDVTDFDAVHGPADATAERALIFGALPIEPAPADVPASTAAFLGRWEGYGLAPPIRRDWKYVLAVTSISRSGGTAYLWAATNLQFPALVERIRFRVQGAGPETAIEWEQTINGAYAVVSLSHSTGTDALEGGATSPDPAGRLGSVLLRRDAAEALVDRDPEARLAGLGVTWRPHADPELTRYGAGSLVYLPPGYREEPDRAWPLVVFLHGSGDRGDNGLVLAQNSPFRWITAGRTLNAVIVAPLLAADQPSFPGAYLDGVLDAALAEYRVDPARVAVTGLSMGGEAAYHLARHRPGDISTLAVLCGFEADTFPLATTWGYRPISEPWAELAGQRVLVVHGRDDLNVPVSAAQAAVDAMGAAGVDVTFSVLEHHDHDVWTATYSDPAFYEWLLAGDS